MKMIAAAAVTLAMLLVTPAAAGDQTEPAQSPGEDDGVVMTTVAGTGELGSAGDGGPAAAATLARPDAVAAAADGTVYVADALRNIRAIQPDGTITAVAGTGESGFSGDGGPAAEAALAGSDGFWSAGGMDVGPDGTLYIADRYNHRVRAIAPDGTINTVAGSGPTVGDADGIMDAGSFGEFSGDGGPATEARLSNPLDVAVGPDGTVYIADTYNYRVRAVDEDGVISTVAGVAHPGDDGVALFPDPGDEEDAAATEAFVEPDSVAVGSDGTIYFLERDERRVRAVDPTTGELTTVFDRHLLPDKAVDLAVSADGTFFVSVFESNVVHAINPAEVTVETFGGGDALGDGGAPDEARLRHPLGVDVGPDGELYIADTEQHRIRQVAPEKPADDADGPAANEIITFAGSGTPLDEDEEDDTGSWLYGKPYLLDVRLMSPRGVVTGPDGTVYVADTGNNRIRSVDPDDGTVDLVAGTGEVGDDEESDAATDASITPVALVAGDGVLHFIDQQRSRIRTIDLDEGTIETPRKLVDDPWDIDVDADGTMYVATGEKVCTIEQDAKKCATIIGDDDSATEHVHPASVTVADDGTVYVADSVSNRVRAMHPDDGELRLVAGNGEPTVSGDGGPAVAAGIGRPTKVEAGADGLVYIVATNSHVVRAVDPQSGIIHAVAGTLPDDFDAGAGLPPTPELSHCGNPELAGDSGGDGGPAAEAALNRPHDVAVGPDGQVYVADTCNNRIRAAGADVAAPERGANLRPWLVLGVPIVMVLAAGVGVFFLIRRRRAASEQAPSSV